MERTARRGDGDRRPTACRPRTGSPATCSRSSPSCRSRRTTRRLHQLRVVDQMGGPQQLLPQLTQFQPADTPERLEAFLARLHAYPGVHGRQHADPARRPGVRPDRAAHRRRADDRPDRADARDPDRVGDRAVDGQGRVARPTASASATLVRDVGLSGRPGVPRRAPGRLPRRDAARSPGIWSAPERRAALPDRDPELDDARPRPRARSTGSASTSSSRSRPSAARSPRAAGFGDDTAAYRAALDADPANTPETKDELVARATEDIERAMAARAALLRRPAAGAPARSARSRSTRRRTRRSPTTTRRRPTARGPGSTTPTATTCRAASTRSSPRRPTTRPRRATTSRSRSRWRTRT